MPAGLAVIFKLLRAGDIGYSLKRTTGHRPGIIGRGVTREMLAMHDVPP